MNSGLVAPERPAPDRLAVAFARVLRGAGLEVPVGATLGAECLDEWSVDATLGTILKYHEDHARVRRYGLEDLVRAAASRS